MIIEGDVAAVKAAVEAAREEAGGMGPVIGINVIPRPEEGMDMLFN